MRSHEEKRIGQDHVEIDESLEIVRSSTALEIFDEGLNPGEAVSLGIKAERPSLPDGDDEIFHGRGRTSLLDPGRSVISRLIEAGQNGGAAEVLVSAEDAALAVEEGRSLADEVAHGPEGYGGRFRALPRCDFFRPAASDDEKPGEKNEPGGPQIPAFCFHENQDSGEIPPCQPYRPFRGEARPRPRAPSPGDRPPRPPPRPRGPAPDSWPGCAPRPPRARAYDP